MTLTSNIVNYPDNYFMEMYQVRKHLLFNGYIYYILYKEMLPHIDVSILLNKNWRHFCSSKELLILSNEIRDTTC